MLLRDFSLFFVPSRCWLYVRVLSNFRPRYLGHSSDTIFSPSICIFNSLFASRLLRWKTFVTDLLGFSFKCHFRKYFCMIIRSSFSVSSSSVKVLAWATSATSSAYMNFLELVQAMSAVYVLKRIGDNTDPCGSPFCSIL